MSLRLEPCDQTSDDAVIWAEVVFRLGTYGTNAGPLGQVVWTRSLMQDRRDGELMLLIARTRRNPVGKDPMTGLEMWWDL